jgi:periplasmic divalent cation tolerance protein
MSDYNPATETLLVMTTLPDPDSATRLAEYLVTQKLAACINILPSMTSVYIWKEKLERGSEHLLLIKTRRERFDALAEAIKSQHPYELPEIIAIPVVAGLPAYLHWIAENTAEHH